MPTLNWIGKDKVINHHLDVPYRILDKQYTYNADASENKIIHGDNLEALKALLPEYEGRIKCIYIDPPYNTGNEGWVYNDNVNDPKIKKWLGEVVGKESEDLTRHDKWLCMMYPRLKLLHRLLADDGVIFISINDIEVSNLRLICDEIFGGKNFFTQMIWNTEGNTDNQLEVKINHEYILVYLKRYDNKEDAIGRVIDPNTKEDSNLWKGIADNNINKNNIANPPEIVTLPIGFPCTEEELYYESKKVDDIFFEITQNEKIISDAIKQKYLIENVSGLPVKLDDMVVKNYKLIRPCRIYAGFANRNKLEQFINNDLKPIDDNGSPMHFYLNKNAAVRYRKENDKPRNILSVLRNFGTTEKTRTELKRNHINFSYPKPVDLIKYILSFGAESQNSIILDSFAGSGTTANAVINLNKQDGGNRKFILVEMEDYADDITAKRVKRVIDGYGEDKSMEGTGGNFSYYELGQPMFIENDYLNEELPLQEIHRYIWYTETARPFDESQKDHSHLLGVNDNSSYYFFYEKDSLTTLNHEFLQTIEQKSDTYVIYADNCVLPKEFMAKNNIIFKKIPRDITRF